MREERFFSRASSLSLFAERKRQLFTITEDDMKKIHRKNLVLSSDTVRTMTSRDLAEVAGGFNLTMQGPCISAPCPTDTCGRRNCI